jgi:GNAT superfamily N-acetyltransferase
MSSPSFIVTRLDAPPPESIKSQIMQSVIDSVTELSMVAIAPSNPLYPLYQYGVGHEVHQYLQAMDGTRGIAVELIVALDAEDPSIVVGFLLYLPVQEIPEPGLSSQEHSSPDHSSEDQSAHTALPACAVAYMAVQTSRRRQGVARAMLSKMTERYPHAELACFVAKVPVFEALGFQVLGARGPQVLMNTLERQTDGLLAVLDVAPIYNSLEVRQIHSYLLKQHGKRAMTDAEKQRDRHLDQLTRQARLFVNQRLGEQGEQAARAFLHGPRLV